MNFAVEKETVTSKVAKILLHGKTEEALVGKLELSENLNFLRSSQNTRKPAKTGQQKSKFEKSFLKKLVW